MKVNSFLSRGALLLMGAGFLLLPVRAAFPESQREALIAFYNATGGPDWKNNDRWLDEPGTECNWYGVDCTNGELGVLRLLLNNNWLSGPIPPEISQLETLTEIDLRTNGLTSIPSEMGQLSRLEELDLSSNELTGTVPV